MSKPSYTPGKWKIKEYDHARHYIVGGPAIVCGKKEIAIPIHDGSNYDEFRHNARLIAASPQRDEFLREIAGIEPSGMDSHEWLAKLRFLIHKSQALLAEVDDGK